MSTLRTSTTAKFEEAGDAAATAQSSVLIVLPKTDLYFGDDFIGKTFFSLVKALSGPTTKVSLLILDHGTLTKVQKSAFVAECAAADLHIQYLIPDKYVHLVGPKSACDSYLFYQWLLDADHFDVVHVPEWLGLGYFALLAKHQGLHFEDTHFVMDVHGPTFWRASLEQTLISSPEFLALNYIEKESLRLADSVFSPLPIFLEILTSHGWILPEGTYRLQLSKTESTNKPSALSEIAYLGTMDERDGLGTFCDVIDRLADKLLAANCQVSFRGPTIENGQKSTQEYLNKRGSGWKFSWQLVDNESQLQSIAYIATGSKLAVVGGTTLASMLHSVKCWLAGVPFLCNAYVAKNSAANTIPAACMFEDEASLASAIQLALSNGVEETVETRISALHTRWWKDAHQTVFKKQETSAFALTEPRKISSPLVTVCLAHFNRPKLLEMALESLNAQSYDCLEVIVGDDGSNEPGVQEALDELLAKYGGHGLQILRLPHRNVGPTRTSVAEAANGEYLLFMDDDNIALPHEISTLVKVSQRTGADIVTCSFDAFTGDGLPPPAEEPLYRKIFLGNAVECGLTENIFGDANALIRKSLFFEQGGFDDEPAVAWQDWDFFAKAVLRGAHLEAVPDPLYLYRVAANSMNRNSSEWRSAQSIIRQYEKAMPPQFKPLPAMLFGLSRFVDGTGSGAGDTDNTQPAPGDVASFKELPKDIATESELATESKLIDSRADSRPSEPSESGQLNATNTPNVSATNSAASPSHENAQSKTATIAQKLRSNRLVKVAYWLCTMQLPAKVIARQKRIKQISTSPLFDSRWYRSQYGINEDPVKHYMAIGAASGFDPGPNFNSRWYKERYSDCQSSSLTPFEHYIEIGAPLHRLAQPEQDPLFKDFDSTWYMSRHLDLAGISIMPFVHFVLYGKDEGRTANPKSEPTYELFDADWYMQRYAEAHVTNMEPFLEYCCYGISAGRAFSAREEERRAFNADWYITRYPDVLDSEMDPFEHYLQVGKQKQYAPFAEADPEAKDFDVEWYSNRYPDIEESSVPPLLHYLLYGRREGRLKKAVDGPNSVASALGERFPDQETLRMFSVPRVPKRLTLFIDELISGSLLGRRGTAIIFAVLWCQSLKCALRIVTRGQALPSSKISALLAFYGAQLPKATEFVALSNDGDSAFLSAGANEIFLCSSWQSTARILKTVPASQIVYLLQEDERLALGGHDDVLRCSEVLANENIRFVVNTAFLYQHMLIEGFENFRNNATSFEPAFPRTHFRPETGSTNSSGLADVENGKKNFFFYARPDKSATLFYRGLEVIGNAIEQNVLDNTDWNFYFVGTNNPGSITLPRSITPHIIKTLDRSQYTSLLGSMDLGISLMHTPHPGYPTLELAASGAVVITNRYSNKSSLDSYCKNIICAAPSIDELTDALKDGASLSADQVRRNRNYAQNSLKKDWSSSFQQAFQFLSKPLKI